MGSIDLTSPPKAEPLDLDSKENNGDAVCAQGGEGAEGDQLPLRNGPAEGGDAAPVQRLLSGKLRY